MDHDECNRPDFSVSREKDGMGRISEDLEEPCEVILAINANVNIFSRIL